MLHLVYTCTLYPAKSLSTPSLTSKPRSSHSSGEGRKAETNVSNMAIRRSCVFIDTNRLIMKVLDFYICLRISMRLVDI